MGVRDDGREEEKHMMHKRNIYWLPLTHIDRESNSQPFGARMVFQPTEPPSQGQAYLFLFCFPDTAFFRN